MVAYTGTYNLPYAQSTDNFCDGAAIIQQLAEAVDAVLDGFDTDAARTEVVPYARMSLATAYVTDLLANAGSDLLTYDTVDTDTANIADTVKDSKAMHVEIGSGIWLTGAYLHHSSTGVGGAGGNVTTLYIDINKGTDDDHVANFSERDLGAAVPSKLNVSSLINSVDYTSQSDVEIGAYVGVGGTIPDPLLVTIGVPSQIFAWWVADTP